MSATCDSYIGEKSALADFLIISLISSMTLFVIHILYIDIISLKETWKKLFKLFSSWCGIDYNCMKYTIFDSEVELSNIVAEVGS